MQKELETLRATEKELRTRVRDMELDNDDLEKSEREKDSSLQNLETRYNKALERIALLEEELVAKAQLEEEVQRLKDEVRDVNEELLVTRSQVEAAEKTAAPTLTTRPTLPSPSPPDVPPPATETADADSTLQRRTPSPESSPPPPSSPPREPLVDPTPLPARIRRASLIPSPPTSISPSKVSRPPVRAEPFPSPPPPTGKTPFRAPLGRSTRTAHLQTYGLGRSPSSPALASPSNRPRGAGARGGGGGGVPDLPRTDTATMIRDMQQMTSRVRMLTQRLDQRRSSVMRGSAIPRFGSPATAMGSGAGTGGDESPTSRGLGPNYPPRTMSRSSTLRTLGMNGNGTMAPPAPAQPSSRPPAPPLNRPPSRLGERDSTRPPSRSAVLRASIASSMAAAQARAPAITTTTTTTTSSTASSSRPSSRMSIASSTATSSSVPPSMTRPGPRSATPTNGYYPPTACATTSRAGSGLSSASTGHPHPPRPGSSLGRSSLSKSVAAASGSTHASGHARHGSTTLGASLVTTRSGRATPRQDELTADDDDDRHDQLRSNMRRTSMGGGGANRRASGIGLGLASNSSSSTPLSKSLAGGGGRRASLAASFGAGGGREGPHGDHLHHHHHRRTATREEVPPVPPLPTASR